MSDLENAVASEVIDAAEEKFFSALTSAKYENLTSATKLRLVRAFRTFGGFVVRDAVATGKTPSMDLLDFKVPDTAPPEVRSAAGTLQDYKSILEELGKEIGEEVAKVIADKVGLIAAKLLGGLLRGLAASFGIPLPS